MPIITKPASIEKNSPAEISLDKSALAAVASVAASTYYSDSENWKEVFIYYKSSVGNQREVLKFNATMASPVATFLVSEKARDIFQVQKIVIVDFDNGSITVPRSQLTVADFDVDMTPNPAVGLFFETISSGVTRNGDAINLSQSESLAYGFDTNSIASNNDPFDITFNLTNMSSNKTVFVGLADSVDAASGAISYSRLSVRITDTSVAYLDVGGSQHILISSGSVGANLSVRIQQVSNQLKFYIDGNLLGTHSIQYPFSPMNPFIRTVSTSANCLATENAAPSVVWDFASRPEYSLNAQSEVVSSLTSLTSNTSDILFSLSEYTIPANGLELKMIANSGFLSLNQFEFFGVCNSSISSFSGFYRDYDTQYGVQNSLQSLYSYPATPEVEFKIIIKTTETMFYVNNVLLGTLGPVTVGPSIKVATRFDNDLNIKSCTITEL